MPKKCPTGERSSTELSKVRVRHRPRGWNNTALFLLNVHAAPPVGLCSIISLSSYVIEQFLLNIPRKPRVLALNCSSTVLSCFKLSAFMFEFNPMSSTQSGKKASSSQHLFCTFNSWLPFECCNNPYPLCYGRVHCIWFSPLQKTNGYCCSVLLCMLKTCMSTPDM